MEAIPWTIRLASIAYAAALLLMLQGTRLAAARAIWIAGCGLYLAHVASAFTYRHGWSHTSAWEETARQTRELFGMYWGGGIWFNYAFTLVWLVDAIWWLAAAESRSRRPWRLSASIHAFMAFMFVNGAIVFANGWTRWCASAAAIAILRCAIMARRSNRSRP